MTSALEGILDDAELALAPDKLGTRLVGDVDAEARVSGQGPSRRGIGSALPFASTGSACFVIDGLRASLGTSSRRRGSR